MSKTIVEANLDTNRIAAQANMAMFDRERTAGYASTAPHLSHAQVRELYTQLVSRVFRTAKQRSETPRILDVGAGEGSATIPFLDLGAHVTALDISESQLEALTARCGRFGSRLEVRQGEMSEILDRERQKYDVVVMISFLHHIPDYLSAIRKAVKSLYPHGQFFSFQDPLRYDTLGPGTWLTSNLGYFSWRLSQGNYVRGLKTRIRRVRGIYVPGSKEDDAEYHATRNGVDQNAINDLLEREGFGCEVIRYFSTQSWAFQWLGTSLQMENTFAIVAQKLG